MSLTWIPRAAIGTRAIARDRLYELLQRALVSCLLALIQCGRHIVAGEAAVARRWRCGARSGAKARGSRRPKAPLVIERIIGLERLPYGRRSENGCRRKKGELETECPPRCVSDH